MNRNERIMQMVDEGRSYSEIADEIGTSRSAVAGVVHRTRGGPVRKYDYAELERRWLAGESIRDIAAALGIPNPRTVSALAHQNGLPSRFDSPRGPRVGGDITPLLKHLRTVDGWSDDRIKRVLGPLAA